MYARFLTHQHHKSFFLFGPRGTGKTSWVKAHFPTAVYLDLLKSDLYTALLAAPQRLETYIPRGHEGWVVIDEVQRVPELLNEVHRLIESQHVNFVLTGSSARKLRQKGVNLLAGRALTYHMHPLTAKELGKDFDFSVHLKYGGLPEVYIGKAPQEYLASYVETYLREEVQQEGLTRNLGAFTRFLEAASFSQASVLNISEVARECSIERKVVENYFAILEDLLIAHRIPVFSKKAQRKTVAHPKFFYFDTGVYRAIRPKGPLDLPEMIDGAALETCVFQELRAMNDYFRWGYGIYYWRVGEYEVDFVLYGERGIAAIEVKRTARPSGKDLKALNLFLEAYPLAKALLLYGGQHRMKEGKVDVVPLQLFLAELEMFL